MLTGFQWLCIVTILIVTYAGGYLPLFKPKSAREGGFPSGEAFTAGVFLALSLTLMLPSAFTLWKKAYPDLDYPIASFIAILAFVFLLALEHFTGHITKAKEFSEDEPDSPVIPIIMTMMIAIPSFFLGTALGISGTSAAILIFIAILTHKSSAAFALALRMSKSSMDQRQSLIIFSLFACSTPLGILLGSDIHRFLGDHTMLVIKGAILALASGTFLYMSTVHEFQHTPMIENCGCKKGYLMMLCGFIITALVRFLIGEAHHLG